MLFSLACSKTIKSYCLNGGNIFLGIFWKQKGKMRKIKYIELGMPSSSLGHIGTLPLMSFEIDFDSGSWAPTIYMYEMDHVEI